METIKRPWGEQVRLPFDADGVPVHPRDELYDYETGTKVTVEYLTLGPDGWSAPNCDIHKMHREPLDTFELIIDDAVKNGYMDPDNANIHERLVERCKKTARRWSDE